MWIIHIICVIVYFKNEYFFFYLLLDWILDFKNKILHAIGKLEL